MSIHTIKQDLAGVEGAGDLTMRYEDGGKFQVLRLGTGVEVRLHAMASHDEIVAALRAAAINA